MTNVQVYNMEGSAVESMELNPAVFDREINEGLIHQAVVLYLASQRQGTQKAKTRSEVSGGGRKPWRQKGTGHARSGSSRSPIWRHGGVIFAPTPRSYGFKMPRKQRRIALASALTAKMQAGELIVLDKIDFEIPKTKAMLNVLGKFDANNALVVFAGDYDNVVKSARNIVGVEAVNVTGVNTYKVLNHKKLILTKDAVARLEEVLANA
ncbi:MAG TPA: 50S ribosomal protein L4 [Candidatus Avidehalobacter gallistercoris]|uniref:Large ribosomal subunit protein uL4 n=1 Tax=Candidatus Avidehalobacter gallistercoris TaxID=2840694 RepID=A0A9D1HJM7_9FIRM|nr:50S ribosomal protein L4 [Candidatus Avidehalobacter gallistercoris]